MEIISEMTNYTAIVLGSTSKENKVTKTRTIHVGNYNPNVNFEVTETKEKISINLFISIIFIIY